MLKYATNSPEFDFEPFSGPPPVRYILASTPRSGSNYLTRALWKTGLAGFPDEYFAEAYVDDFVSRWQLDRFAPSFFPQLLQLLLRHRTSPNGVFGIKLHASHLRSSVLQRHDLHDALEAPKYLWIVRRNRYLQAISYLRAEQTGVWIIDGEHLPPTKPIGEPTYDFQALLHCLRSLDADALAWEKYFGTHGVDPMIVEYEKLVDQYDLVVRDCLLRIGAMPADFDCVPEAGIKRQADMLSMEWLERFLMDLRSDGHVVKHEWLA